VPSYLCVTHGIQPKRPCPECRREKDRRRKRTPKRRATMGVGPEGARYKRQRVAYLKLTRAARARMDAAPQPLRSTTSPESSPATLNG
jgi:hypothetical protein